MSSYALLAQVKSVNAKTYFNDGWKHNTDTSKDLDKTLRVKHAGQDIGTAFSTGQWGKLSCGAAFKWGQAGGTAIQDQEETAFSVFGAQSMRVNNLPLTITAGLRGNFYSDFDNSVNPEIKAGWQKKRWDLGLEYRLRKDRVVQATLFRTETRDLIVYRRGADLIYQPVNIDEAWRHGIEFTVKYTWDIGLSLDLNYILQDSENPGMGKELAYTPRHKVKTTLKCTLPGWATRLETSFRYQSDCYSEAEARESEKLDDYATLDLKLLQPFTWGKTRWEGYLNLYNLFDQDFENYYGYPDDGFRLTAGFNLTF